MNGRELYEAVRTPDSQSWRGLSGRTRIYWGKRAAKLTRKRVKIEDIRKGR